MILCFRNFASYQPAYKAVYQADSGARDISYRISEPAHYIFARPYDMTYFKNQHSRDCGKHYNTQQNTKRAIRIFYVQDFGRVGSQGDA